MRLARPAGRARYERRSGDRTRPRAEPTRRRCLAIDALDRRSAHAGERGAAQQRAHARRRSRRAGRRHRRLPARRGRCRDVADAHSPCPSTPWRSPAIWTRSRSGGALDDAAGQVRCLQGIASVDIYIGDYALAMGASRRRCGWCRTVSDEVAADVQHRLGMVYARLGDLTRAREFYEASLDRRRVLGDTPLTACEPEQPRRAASAHGRPAAIAPDLAREDLHRARASVRGSRGRAPTRPATRTSRRSRLENVGSAVAVPRRSRPSAHAVPCAARGGARDAGRATTSAVPDQHRRGAAPLGRFAEALDATRTSALKIGEELKSKERTLRAWHELSQCQEALGDPAPRSRATSSTTDSIRRCAPRTPRARRATWSCNWR